MALVKEKPAAAKPAGKFEEDSTVAAPAPAVNEPKAAAEATTAIVKAKSSSLAALGKFEAALVAQQNAMPPVDYGTFPRLVGSSGNVMDKDGRILGSYIDMTLLSWNETFVVSPGVDTDEAKEAVKYSRDGVTIDDTKQPVADYLKQLRETEGYKDASSKRYIELVGVLEAAEKDKTHVGQLVQVSLSPQSLKSFEAYRANASVMIRLGRQEAEGVESLRVTPEVKTKGAKSFTLLKVQGAPKAA